ncbi:MAG: hypothetical protein ACOWWR_10745 [Eubacteriales bacterium]
MEILVIENNTEIFSDLEKCLSLYKSDFGLVSCVSGTQCLVDIATNNKNPKLLIIGINPSCRKNVLYLVAQIRDYSDIPIVVLSYDNNINTLVSYFDAGINNFISYPYNKEIFVALLKAVIRRRKWDTQKPILSKLLTNSQPVE